jgi:hypothetical protein
MSDHALSLLLRQRRAALDAARRALAEAVAAETKLADKFKSIERAIQRETAMAERLDTPDSMVETFAVWLRSARADQGATEEALRVAEGATQEARTVLAACRSAVATVETLLDSRRAVENAAAERAERLTLDEIAR